MKLDLKLNHFSYSFFVAGMLLPLPISISRIGFVLLALSLIVSITSGSRRNIKFDNSNSVGLLIVGLVLWNFISMAMHPPLHCSPFEKQITILVIPILLLFNRAIEKKSRIFLIRGFIIGNGILALTNLLKATYQSFRNENSNLFFDSTVWGNISIWESVDHVGNYFFSFYFANSIHPSYWALYLTIAILFLWLEDPFNNKKWTRSVIIGFFLVMIYLCSSRAGITGISISIVVLVLDSLRRREVPWYYFVVVTLPIVISVFLFLNPRVIGSIRSFQDGTYGTSQRWQAWETALVVIKNHGLLGVGSQNAEATMLTEYQNRGLRSHYELKLNAHNQFFETTINDGVIGLMLLISIFVIALARSFKTRDVGLFILMINLMIHFCFESMLSRYYGIVFFALFVPIFFMKEMPEQERLA